MLNNKLAYFLANLSHIFVRLNFQLNYCQQSVVATAVPQCEVSVQPPSAKKIAASTDTNGRMEVSRKGAVILVLFVLLLHFANSDYTRMMNESQIDI